MKNYVVFFVVLLQAIANGQMPTNVMTFNIRYATVTDGANQWNNRKNNVATTLRFYEADICGMQEALFAQIEDLHSHLPDYGWVGVGRDDGDQKGEFSPIFYRKSRFEALESKTFWLNEHPETVGFGWDAKFNRIVTWVKLLDTKTQKQIYVFNTHFDHQAETARRESARLLLIKIKEIAGGTPFVVTGDFNATPQQQPIRILKDTSQSLRLVDAKAVSQTPHFGPEGTFNGFTTKETTNEPIDYIFVPEATTVLKHATLSGTWGGLFASDHFAVMATLLFP